MKLEKGPLSKQYGDHCWPSKSTFRGAIGVDASGGQDAMVMNGVEEWMEGEVAKVAHADKSCPELCFEGLMVAGEVCGRLQFTSYGVTV